MKEFIFKNMFIKKDVETPKVLKKAIVANRALENLNGTAKGIFPRSYSPEWECILQLMV